MKARGAKREFEVTPYMNMDGEWVLVFKSKHLPRPFKRWEPVKIRIVESRGHAK